MSPQPVFAASRDRLKRLFGRKVLLLCPVFLFGENPDGPAFLPSIFRRRRDDFPSTGNRLVASLWRNCMAATKARSVFLVSFAAGLLASAAVLMTSEGAAEPQATFGLLDVELREGAGLGLGTDQPSPPKRRGENVRQTSARRGPKSDDSAANRRAAVRAAPGSTSSRLQLAVATEDTAAATIVLVDAQESIRGDRPIPKAPLPPRGVSPVSDHVEARNWSEVPTSDRQGGSRTGLRMEAPQPGALREWVQERLRLASREAESGGLPRGRTASLGEQSVADAWIAPINLRKQLLDHAEDAGVEMTEEWAAAMLAGLDAAIAAPGPSDPAAQAAFHTLSELADYGMWAADEDDNQDRASQTRRAALAVARRVDLWQAAADVRGAAGEESERAQASPAAKAVQSLLASIERFEADPTVASAAEIRLQMDRLNTRNVAGVDSLHRAFHDHYLAPNVRIAATSAFADRLMPEPVTERGPVAEMILGRVVRGNRVLKRSTRVVFVPDADDIRLDIEVQGDVFSRTVTDAGPVLVNGNSTSTFTVRKPVKICSEGLLVGDARAVASNRSRVSGMQTSFDGIPLMGSLVRSIARSQQQTALPEANREAARKVINQACRDVDAQSEPQLADLERRVNEKLWRPLVELGLEPVAMAMQTTEDMATVRLRLAGDGQLAGHTPRPRVPADAELSVQVHATSLNNAFDRLEIAGRVFPLEQLYRHIGQRLGMEVQIPDDLPEGVVIGFEEQQPIRVECQDGLVHVTMRIDSIESGRRDWYDVEAGVSYRLVPQDPQVLLEREGPIRIGGEGQRGRFAIALRTVVGKIFPKERPIPLLPAKLAGDPRLADLDVCQAVVTDGWLAIALGDAGSETPEMVRAPSEGVLRK